MMKYLCIASALAGTAAQADVLGLNDYEALFAAPDAAVAQLEDGTQVISLDDTVQISRDGDRITTLDITDGGAVGCFVRILSQIEAYQTACDSPIEVEVMENHRTYLDQVLSFYADNTFPVSDAQTVRDRYDAFVAGSAANARQYCGGDRDVETFMRNVLRPTTQAALDHMTSIPRLPADNPCL